ncbi:MAG TPA: hypothetical protein VGK39_05550 [Cyclobacteriaceae bacterium]
MTKKRLINRDELLKHKVGVRFDEKTFNKLKAQVQQSNASTVGELVRKIVTGEKVTFFVKDISMEGPTAELIRIRKEINAIGRNINQLTEAHHTSSIVDEKIRHLLEVGNLYRQVADKVSEVWKLVSEMSLKWSAK